MFLHAQLTLGISGFQCIWRSSEVSALFAAQTAVPEHSTGCSSTHILQGSDVDELCFWPGQGELQILWDGDLLLLQ